MQERSSNQPDKSRLRRILREKRDALSTEEIRQASTRIQKHLLDQEQIRQAQSVMLYLPCKNEVDTWLLAEHFWAHGAEVLLPRCCDTCLSVMDIYVVTNRQEIAPGRHGIPEPRPELTQRILRPKPEVILLPALAFDRLGHRLGFGLGYYDRFLSTLDARPLLIGMAYAFQILDHLPADPWDVPVHCLATPDGILTITLEQT